VNSSDPLREDDFVFENDLSLGDQVGLRRRADGRTGVFKLAPEQVASFPGRVFRIDPTEDEAGVYLTLVRGGVE
jgi:hypothetical protein